MAYKYSASMFIGTSLSGTPSPVFFDLHTPIVNNHPPGALVTGAPGSGKTFFALTLAAISAILGKITVVIDPKGDFLALCNIREEIGKMNIWELDRGRAGLLDPFYMTESQEERLNLAIQVIDIFVGGLREDQTTALSPIIKDVMDDDNPSLQKVVDELRGSEKETARHLGTQLDLIRKMKYAKLCFAPGNVKRKAISITEGLTIITLLGLNLPGEDGPQDRGELLASGILFLLTDFIRRIMKNEKTGNPKTVIIDEAHAIISTPNGAKCIKDMALLGRSKNLALLLITQNNAHITNLNIENTISTRFAFRSTRKEAESIIKDMELPTDENFENIILDLDVGQCLMKDDLKRYAAVQISNWRKDWAREFDTNPLEKMNRERERAEAARKQQRLAKNTN